MPVILPPDDYEAWLGENSVRAATKLLSPYPADGIRAYCISTVVSNAPDGASKCIERAT